MKHLSQIVYKVKKRRKIIKKNGVEGEKNEEKGRKKIKRKDYHMINCLLIINNIKESVLKNNTILKLSNPQFFLKKVLVVLFIFFPLFSSVFFAIFSSNRDNKFLHFGILFHKNISFFDQISYLTFNFFLKLNIIL